MITELTYVYIRLPSRADILSGTRLHTVLRGHRARYIRDIRVPEKSRARAIGIRAYAQRKEALRKLSNQRSSAFSYYWTDLQNARARLDAMQRKYDAELKNKLFVLRQAQAKAGRDAREFKVGCCMALPPSRALIVVPTEYTRS